MKVSDFLMLREFATTWYPRSRNDWTTPAPMPCEAPVTMTVFCLLAMFQPPWLLVEMRGDAVHVYSEAHGLLARNSVTNLMVACGFSSMIQCLELGTMPPVTLLA